jgi:hypothetical protein
MSKLGRIKVVSVKVLAIKAMLVLFFRPPPMNTRLLKVTLGKALLDEMGNTAKTKFAREIGVSPKKLTAMINDEWNYITRSAIERAADRCGLGAHDIFSFEPIEFWKQIETLKHLTFIRGSHDLRAEGRGVSVRTADQNAINVLSEFIGDRVAKYDYETYRRDEQAELIERVKLENCIVIGSPKSNAATEILLSRFFRAQPFDPSDDERYKIPFGFCWPSDSELVAESTLTCSSLARERTKGRTGIAIKGAKDVEADYMSPEEFANWSTKKGKDCGLVFVANKPFGTERPVKLIVLAGFSGMGTIGAAKALVEDYRYLEPYPHEDCVYGIVECLYSKVADTTVRTLDDVKWRYRKSGYMPMGVKAKKRTTKGKAKAKK